MAYEAQVLIAITHHVTI